MISFNHNYPIGAFPACIRQAIYEVQQQVQAPIELVSASALCAVSIACQALIDVKTPVGTVLPVSLYLFTVADSGERKSSTDKMFIQPLLDFEQQGYQTRASLLTKYEARHQIWEIKHKNLISKMKQAIKKGEETQTYEEQLAQLNTEQPKAPPEHQLIYSDTTPEALLYGLYTKGSSAGLVSSEGGILLKRSLSQQLSQLNMLWDGETIQVDRRQSESFTLINARLTLSAMVQSKPFEEFIGKKNETARDIGFLARVLMAYPVSVQGTRQICASNQTETSEYLKLLHQRVRELLVKAQEANARETLSFLPDAAQIWLSFYNTVEGQIGVNGYYEDIKDAASKISNNAARLAALFHYFSGRSGPIGAEAMHAACCLSEWYLNEFKRLLGAKSPYEVQQEEANLLLNWLRRNFIKTGQINITKRQLLQYGPNRLRNKEALSMAIFLLTSWGCIIDFSHLKPASIQLNTNMSFV